MLSLNGVEVDFGTRLLFRNVSFMVQHGDRIGLVGRNGAGKSTLMHIMAGERQPTSGEVHRQNNFSVGLLSQDLTIDLSHTLRETALQAFEELLKLQDRMDEYQHQVSTRTDYESDDYLQLVQKLTDAHEQFERGGGMTMHADIERILTGLGFEQSELDNPLTAFSGGWQMRAELGRLLLSHPDLLLLDEPTNHLDIESVQWLEEFLQDYDGAVIAISHDRTFLDNITKRTIEIMKSKIFDIPASYSDFEQIRAERMELQKAAAARQARERARVQKFIDRFRYKASLASRAQSRIKQLAKMESIDVDESDTRSMHFTFPPAPRSGRTVVDCINIVKDYGDKHVLKGLNFALERGEKVAFIGKNGEGKTTLSKIIGGFETATNGEVRIGHNVSIGFYAQQQADLLGGQHTVYETLEQGAPPEMRPRLRSLLGAFLFSGDDVNKKVGVLSGGEKSRLALARLLLQPYNLLILDEPTNHLDMLSKEVLKQSLLEYDGAMIVVSHDRDFLDGLTDRVLAFRHGDIQEYEGDIDDYVNSLRSSLPHTSPSMSTLAIDAQEERARQEEPAQVSKATLSREEQKAAAREKKRLQKRVDDIERQIGVQEKTIKECEQILGEPDLYQDPVRQHKTTTKYETAKGLVVSLMEEWEQIQQQLEEVTHMTRPLMILAVLTMAVLTMSAQNDRDDRRTISVTGEAKAYFEPDRALVSIGVETDGKTVMAAKEDNDERTSQLIAAIKKVGIPASDIQTSQLNIVPVYDYKSDDRRLIKYTMRNMVRITVRDIKKVEEVINAGLTNGGNLLNGLSFYIEDAESVRDSLRVEAAEDARQKAQRVAGALGVTVGKPVSINVSSRGGNQPMMMDANRFNARVMAESASTTEVSTGQIVVKANVSIVFELE